MKHVKRLIALLLLIPIGLAVVIFVLDNPELISVQLFGFSMGALSTGAWMMLSFVIGGFAGLLSGVAVIFRLRARNALLTKTKRTK